MSDQPEEPMQTTIFGDEVPLHEIPRATCSNSADCKAIASEHLDTCPIEIELKKVFGY